MITEEQNKVLDAWQTSARYWGKYRVLIEQMFAPLTVRSSRRSADQVLFDFALRSRGVKSIFACSRTSREGDVIPHIRPQRCRTIERGDAAVIAEKRRRVREAGIYRNNTEPVRVLRWIRKHRRELRCQERQRAGTCLCRQCVAVHMIRRVVRPIIVANAQFAARIVRAPRLELITGRDERNRR